MKRMMCAILLAVSLALLAGCRGAGANAGAPPAKAAASGPPMAVFVPCGMIDAFRAAQVDFEKDTGIHFKPTFDNAPVLLRRIKAKEPCDVLITPGRLEMKQMEEAQQIDPASVVTFGRFKLIVVVPASNPAGLQSYKDLLSPKVKAIGVADSTQNSVGWYADQSLTKLGMLDKLTPKIQRNWHAKTAVDWVCRGRVEAGIYFDQCPFQSGEEKVEGGKATYHIVGELPEDSYPPIQVQAGRTTGATHKAEADKLLQWMMSASGRKSLTAHGIPPFEGQAAKGGKT